LFLEGCRVVVVACHTVSCVALRHLQHRYGGPERRILGVTIPAAEAAVSRTRGHIGFIGTMRTVASHTFRTEMAKLDPNVRVTEVAAPLLAPIVEEGWETTEIARLAVERYLAQFDDIDTLVLGCTHYPLLRPIFEAAVLPGVEVIDPAPFVATRFVNGSRGTRSSRPLIQEKQGYYVCSQAVTRCASRKTPKDFSARRPSSGARRRGARSPGVLAGGRGAAGAVCACGAGRDSGRSKQ
jgi:glutamate racemase